MPSAPHLIARRRLRYQYLATPIDASPADLVRTLGAVQAQDYLAAKWALGLRLRGATDENVERAYDAGAIVRTHVLRPTWHFVHPADLRWLLALTGPRVHVANAHPYRELELDATVFRRSHAVLERALRDGRHRTRPELAEALARAGIDVREPRRVNYLLMAAELDGVICSGPRRGKQLTYALLEERVPPAPPRERDEALAALAVRYFTTRGPATVHDFSWWSGLTIADARRAVEAAGPTLVRETIGDREHWAPVDPPRPRMPKPLAHLLPNFDEYFVGLRDRSAMLADLAPAHHQMAAAALARHLVTIDGQVAGSWTRTLTRRSVTIALQLLRPLDAAERRALTQATERYGAFLQLPATVTMTTASSRRRRRVPSP